MQAWLAEYWDECGAALLTLFIGLNAVYSWVPADVVTVLLAVAGSLGIRVLKSADAKVAEGKR